MWKEYHDLFSSWLSGDNREENDLFSWQFFLVLGTITFSFVFSNYCLTMD